jgi:hypothetical protein
LLAGADAVQVGTATFRDPRAPWKVLRQLAKWCDSHSTSVAEIRQGVRGRVGGGAVGSGNDGVDRDHHDHTHDAAHDHDHGHTHSDAHGGAPGAAVPLLNEGGRDG